MELIHHLINSDNSKIIEMKKIVCLFLCLLVVFAFFCINISAEVAFPDTSHANAVCLYNLNTNKSIYSKNTDKKIFPAGAVKMTTGLIACQMLSERLDEQVTVKKEMLTDAEGANIKLKEGMTLKIKDLLYGVLCGGGNDAALVLANVCAGSTEAFVRLMNAKANEWGLNLTHFTNPTGIDDKDMYSTVSDIITVAKHAVQNELYIEASSAASYEFLPIGSQNSVKFFNRNALISTFYSADYKYSYASGLIVGNTELGGNCVISLAKKNGTEYICAVMGADMDETNNYSYEIATEMFSFAFNNFSYVKIAEAGMLYEYLSVSTVLPQNGKNARVRCVLKDDIYSLTQKGIDINNDLTYRYYFHENPIQAPVLFGEIVGGVDIIFNGDIIGTGVMIAENDISASTVLVLIENMRSFFTGRFFIAFFVTFAILVLLYFFVYEKYDRHRSSRAINYNPRKKQ